MKKLTGILLSIGLSIGIASSISAQEMKHDSVNKFQPIEQPLALKVAIVLGGLSLIVG